MKTVLDPQDWGQSAMTQEITDEDRIEYDPFSGDESVKCRKVTLKVARKQHACFLGGGYGGDKHTIEPGDRYRHEKALVDGDFWGEWKCCLNCIDKECRRWVRG